MPSNIDDVIADVEGVKHSLRDRFHTYVYDAMGELLNTTITQIEKDADWTGDLKTSVRAHGIESSNPEFGRLEWSVGTDSSIAPYAAWIEFGTGKRTEDPSDGSYQQIRNPDNYPNGFPYESPNIDPEHLVGQVYEWMETKPVSPKKDSMWESAMSITQAIIEKGTHAHPFIRPAWYKNRLKLKRATRKAVKKAFS